MTWPNPKQRVRAAWKSLSQLDVSPGQIAAGFAIGIAAGFVPLNPSPIVVATVVAWLLRRNVLAAIAGATVAILYTPLLPLIWLAEYRLGQAILGGRHPAAPGPTRPWELLRAGWHAYAAMGIGAVMIAGPTALLAYFVVRFLARRWKRDGAEPSG